MRICLLAHIGSDRGRSIISGLRSEHLLRREAVSAELSTAFDFLAYRMRILGDTVFQVLQHPVGGLLRTLKGFQKNQWLLLAGAVAYYALLSIVPFLILTVIALSHLVDQGQLLGTLGRYLEWLVRSQSSALLNDLTLFMKNGAVIDVILLVTMLSSVLSPSRCSKNRCP